MDLRDMPAANNRLLLHLRGLLKRINDSTGEPRHPLHDVTIRECREAYELVKKLTGYLEKEHRTMTDGDRFYLTLHIDRLMRLSKQ